MIVFKEIEGIDGDRRFELVENERIGLAVIALNGTAVEIKSIDLFDGVRAEYFDFFVRSTLNAVRDMDIKIRSLVHTDYLIQFGFNSSGEIASGTKINFSGSCGGK